uniref:Integrase catalytic domain-containing protein n=1 Tax=Fagus sylvatica TaxID=28930 RepID=A0A2N9G206_FAGSY
MLYEMIQKTQTELAEIAKHVKKTKTTDEGLQHKPLPEKNQHEKENNEGSALEHVSKFLDAMGPYVGDSNLCLREFSKSLTNRTYTWYATLQPASMKTWEDMVEIFCGKFFGVKERVILHTLHSVKQKVGEGLLDFIKQFQDLALDCYVNHKERELIKICIDNMLPNYRAHLENLDIAQFAQLLQKARKTAASMNPVERSRADKRSTPHALVVTSSNDTRIKKKHGKEKEFEEWSTIPCTTEEMHAVIDKWIADGFLRLPSVSKESTEDDKKHARSPKFQSLFNQLGLGPDAKKAATEAIVNIVAGSGSQCYTAEAHASRAFLETTNAVTFTDEDMKVQYPDHRKSLYAGPNNTKRKGPGPIQGGYSPIHCMVQQQTEVQEKILPLEDVPTVPNLSPASEEFETINLSNDPNVELPISISSSLSLSEKAQLLPLLKEYRDVFTWQYEEMLGLDLDLVVHALNVDPGSKPIIQPKRVFHPEVEAQISQEVQKLLAPNFIKPIEHPQWLSNIVPVKKKNGKIRSAGHTMFSFMDGFSGYNQIRMSPKDAMKTAFQTSIGNFYYTAMPFGLKNADATYQRAMTAIFHDMMHCELEDYVDDVVVKTETREGHFKTLRRVFERCRQYKLRMNPLKCAFGVAVGKFLGFLVHQQGIDVDLLKAKVIATMKPPMTVKEFKSFLGKLSYIRRFILGLAAVTTAFTPLFKKGVKYEWTDECQQTFQQLQQVMANLPTVKAPIPGIPLRLYLASNDKAIGALVAQEDKEGMEQPIYYIVPITPKAITNKAIADLLAQFLGEDASSINDEVPGEVSEVAFAEISDAIWTLRFDGSSTIFGGGSGVVLTKEGADTLSMSFKLDFPCSNNAAEYKAYLTSLALARELRIKRLKVQGDSNLVLLHEEFAVEPPQEEDWRLPLKESLTNPERGVNLRDFKDYTLVAGELYRRLPHIGYYWPEMKAQASKIQSSYSRCQHVFEKKEAYATFSTSDLRTQFLKYLLESILPETSKEAYHLKQLARCYFIEGGILFRKGFHGEPLRCLGLVESQIIMKEIHGGECGEHQGQKKLHQQLLISSYFWPSMKRDAAEFLKSCHTCQMHSNLIHTHPTSLQNMTTPWPFHTWGLDLIGPINPPSNGCIWILVATEYFTKWVKAIPLKKATGAAVANFIREHIVCCFGIPHRIISDNGIPFINKDVRRVVEQYKIKHCRSTPYYPQRNGQAEATNRVLLRILSKMVFEYNGGWSMHLLDTLWSYRNLVKTATSFSPFCLVYGIEAMSPAELIIPTACIIQGQELEYRQQMSNVYEKTIRERVLIEGQLVLRAADYVRRNVSTPSKFSPNWEGPYMIREAHGSGYYKLAKMDGIALCDPINGKWLKLYHA